MTRIPRTNLVVACWGGHRRTRHPEYEADRAYYLKLQEDSLAKFEHSLAQITFVSTGGDENYNKFLRRLASKYSVMRRDNVGMSYGSFDAAWKAFPDFDYYIFLEDDYLFITDNFDTKLVELFESFDDCGYLCQLIWGLVTPYPSIFNGMASKECLQRLVTLPGAAAFSVDEIAYYGAAEGLGQHAWGEAVQRVGLKLYDMGGRFKAPYLCNYNEFLCWHANAPEYLIVPAQIYHKVLDNPDYVIEYQTTEEDWQQFKTYYLGLRNVYLSDNDRKSLEIVAAPFKIRTREDLARVASVYESSIGYARRV